MKNYVVKRATGPVFLDGDFDADSQWKNASVLKVDYLLAPKNPEFVSDVSLKLLYDMENLYGLFKVNDRYVRAVRTGYQQDVCLDSCVELFIRPKDNIRYYNFEFSANGAMLLYNITDLRGGKFTPIPEADCKTVECWHSLPSRVDPEITEPVTWRIGFRVPISFFVKYASIDPDLSGQVWTANVSKCCDETSHPHWLSWQELSQCDFHLPNEFGQVIFE